jgi:hypothetical protein
VAAADRLREDSGHADDVKAILDFRRFDWRQLNRVGEHDAVDRGVAEDVAGTFVQQTMRTAG